MMGQSRTALNVSRNRRSVNAVTALVRHQRKPARRDAAILQGTHDHMVALPSDILIRRAEARDSFELGELGAALMRVHYAFDRCASWSRGATSPATRGFLTSQLDETRRSSSRRAARRHIVGYVYAAIEPLSWKDLRDERLHPRLLSCDARGRLGVASAARAAIDGCTARHAARGAGHGVQNDWQGRCSPRAAFRPT
jgi:hypothetical protein